MAKALRQGAQVAEWSHVHCEGGTTMNVGKHLNDGCSRPFADALQSPERGSPYFVHPKRQHRNAEGNGRPMSRWE